MATETQNAGALQIRIHVDARLADVSVGEFMERLEAEGISTKAMKKAEAEVARVLKEGVTKEGAVVTEAFQAVCDEKVLDRLLAKGGYLDAGTEDFITSYRDCGIDWFRPLVDRLEQDRGYRFATVTGGFDRRDADSAA